MLKKIPIKLRKREKLLWYMSIVNWIEVEPGKDTL